MAASSCSTIPSFSHLVTMLGSLMMDNLGAQQKKGFKDNEL
jgi:hypothetical protein